MTQIVKCAQTRINQAVNDKEDVGIHFNNETGEWQWSIYLISVNDFWLDSFEDCPTAVRWCVERSMKITEIQVDERS